MEENVMTISDIFKIIRRRKWGIILPTFFVILVSAIVALTIPSYYKSTATILIEGQEIPTDFVMTTVTGYAEQRLQSIQQRIMSTTRLIELINLFNLYPDLKHKWTTEEIVEDMKEDIELETISADVVDRRTGRPTTATIAFTLSYAGKNPETSQKVANKLTSFFLEENLLLRKRQTEETTQFLETEMDMVKKQLSAAEKKISEFKRQNSNKLPELLQVNLQSLNNIEQNIARLKEKLHGLKEREEYLNTQISGTTSTIEEGAERRQIEELEVRLASLRSRFSDEYPDVVIIKGELEGLKKKAKESVPDPMFKGYKNNPTYINLAAQLSSTRSEIDSVRREIVDNKHSWENYRKRIEATHGIEDTYNSLIIERNNAKAKYEELLQKVMGARMAHGLEEQQKGERFTLIDPPRLPEEPFKPNRLAIILIGFVLGIGAGIAGCAIMEFSDNSVRNSNMLSSITSFPVLVEIPMIVTQKDIQLRNRNRIILLGCLCGFGIIGAMIVHFYIMDFNILWSKLVRRTAF